MYFLTGLIRARATRPLIWWVAAVLLYALLPLPQHLVLFLVIGLGVALAATVRRLRDSGHNAIDHVGRAWGLADKLTDAIGDRIRQTPPPRTVAAHDHYSRIVEPPAAPPQLTAGPVYDPGMLLSAVVAVLAAEGLSVSAAAALPACADLLTWQGIGIAPNVPAPDRAGAGHPARAWCAASSAGGADADDGDLCRGGAGVRWGVAAPAHDQRSPSAVGGSARILESLGIAPDPNAESAADWPVMGQIIDAAPRGGW